MPRHPHRLPLERLEDRTTPSTLDPTFGDSGLVELSPGGPVGTYITATKVIGLPDGKVLVLATFAADSFVERLEPDGTPDPTFGSGGRAALVVAGLAVPLSFADMVVTPDGGVVAVGATHPLVPNDLTTHLAVVKLRADGTPDAAFNANAAAVAGFGAGADGSAAAAGVAVAPDGGIVVAGTGYKSYRATIGGGLGPDNPARAGIVRLRPDGTADPAFGGSGTLSFGSESGFDLTGIGTPDSLDAVLGVDAAGVAVDAAGRVILIGTTTPLAKQPVPANVYQAQDVRPYAARLTPDGHLDPAFDGDGIVRITVPSSAGTAGDASGRWVGVGPGGRVVVGVVDRHPESLRLVTARLTAGGAIDPTFGAGGFGQLADPRGFADLAFAADGTAYAVTGQLYPGDPVPGPDAAVYRFAADGLLSGTGSLPVTLVEHGSLPHQLSGTSVGVGPDGRLTVATVSDNGTAGARLTLARPGGDFFSGSVAPPPLGGPPVLIGGSGGTVLRLEPGADGRLRIAGSVAPFAGFTGAVRGTSADVSGDGVADDVLVTGPGAPVRFAVLDGRDHATVLVPPTDPFGSPAFTGGAFVAAGDVDRDGRADIVLTPDRGGGPNVVIYSLNAEGALGSSRSFFALGNPAFRGGARPAVGDLNADGFADLAIGAGFEGGPNAEVHEGRAVAVGNYDALIGSGFFGFDGSDAQTLRNGVFLAFGDLNGDGFADLVVGGGPGGGPRVLALDG